jgi:hypothetical protein
MKEYKIIERQFSWSKGREKFEAEINSYAKQGWCVINIYAVNDTKVEALLERNKNR